MGDLADVQKASYTPKHWLDTDRRGAWLVPVCGVVCVLALWAPLFLGVMRG